MELESLKYIWHTLEAPAALLKDREEVLALVQKKSHAPIARMRQNLIGETVLLLAGYIPAVLCFLLAFGGRFAAAAWLFLLVLAFFFTYYFLKYRLLNKMRCPTCQLRSNLARQIDALKKYTRFYLLAGTGMVPLTWVLAWMIVRWKLDTFPPFYQRLHPAPWWSSPVLWLTLFIPITVAMYFANACYINRLYGRHIKKLQDLLHELDAE